MQVSNPLQQVVLLVGGEDQFPVYESDGFTKVPGLDPEADMVVTVYVNGAVDEDYTAPVIEEIGSTGEYGIAFVATTLGRLQIEVAVADESFVWKGFYDVVNADTMPGQYYRNTVRDRRGNAVEGAVVDVLDASTAELLDTVVSDANGDFAIDLSGGEFNRRLVDLRFTTTGLPTRTWESIVLTNAGPVGPAWDGIRDRLVDTAVVTHTLVKPGTTAGRVAQFLTSDDPFSVVGVALDAAADPGDSVRVGEARGVQQPIKSDGTTVIAIGDPVEVSTTVNGRIKKRSAGVSIGVAMSAAAATVDLLVDVLRT